MKDIQRSDTDGRSLRLALDAEIVSKRDARRPKVIGSVNDKQRRCLAV